MNERTSDNTLHDDLPAANYIFSSCPLLAFRGRKKDTSKTGLTFLSQFSTYHITLRPEDRMLNQTMEFKSQVNRVTSLLYWQYLYQH